MPSQKINMTSANKIKNKRKHALYCSRAEDIKTPPWGLRFAIFFEKTCLFNAEAFLIGKRKVKKGVGGVIRELVLVANDI